MLNSWRKQISIFLLVIFCLFNATATFASTNNEMAEEDGYAQVFKYEENGSIYECYLKEIDSGYQGEIYKLENEEKKLFNTFCVIVDENDNIWLNDKLIVESIPTEENNELMPQELYPVQYHHGKVSYDTGINVGNLGVVIWMTIKNVNPLINVGVSAFMPLANEIIKESLPIVYYQVREQLETFPSDVPPEYFGAVTKIAYKYTLHRTTNYSVQTQIGNAVSDVYYGMPN